MTKAWTCQKCGNAYVSPRPIKACRCAFCSRRGAKSVDVWMTADTKEPTE